MQDKGRTIRPVILSGGCGARLWPISRAGLAKQLLPLTSEMTLLQETLLRVGNQPGFATPMVIGAHAVRFTLREQIEATLPEARLVLEPARRDTLPAVLLAALIARQEDPDMMLAVIPSDHLITDAGAFRRALRAAAAAAADGGLALVGVTPTGPVTGYGYIRPGALVSSGHYRVAEFVEKPDADQALALIAAGCLWNAGVFCFRPGWLCDAFGAGAPEYLAHLEQSVAAMRTDLGMAVLGDQMAEVEAVSFDHGFLEGCDKLHVVAADFSWADIGDWNALWQASEKDDQGNALCGDVVGLGTKNSLIRAESRTVCTLGVEDLVIVETADAVLVTRRAESQAVKGLVDHLSAANRPAATEHRRVLRPWGWYQIVDEGPLFRVKRLMVRPGAQLSLQTHQHRAEHWVIVRGQAQVTIGGTTSLLCENQSTYIPIGAEHRLANPGIDPIEIIEVQTGTYLQEDDIHRIEDDFGRI
ncbi:MAG: mannose-1-phosphate guanylyltransferase/mannose-6-phosphate isomerase [Paracoccaceae bacterium]